MVKNPSADAGAQVRSLGWKDPHAEEQLSPNVRATITEPVLKCPGAALLSPQATDPEDCMP